MKCVKCEVRSAKLKTLYAMLKGDKLEDVADRLSNQHKEVYYIEDDALWRQTKSEPILIWRQ